MSFFACDSDYDDSDCYINSNDSYFGIYCRDPAEVALSIPRPKNPFHNSLPSYQEDKYNYSYQNVNSAFGMPMTSF